MMLNIKKIKPYLICIAICFIVEVSVGLITQGYVNTLYKNLIKPEFTPPKWIFAPVWSLLYLMMGFAWGHVNAIYSDYKITKRANALFTTQLFFNFLWSIIYFVFHNIGYAFLDIILLWLILIWTIHEFFKISKLSGWLLIPYLLWTSYAAILNASILYLNRQLLFICCSKHSLIR
jgi:benzodiazapine receptor